MSLHYLAQPCFNPQPGFGTHTGGIALISFLQDEGMGFYVGLRKHTGGFRRLCSKCLGSGFGVPCAACASSPRLTMGQGHLASAVD